MSDTEGFTSDMPTEEGWYDVVLGDGSGPDRVYVRIGERSALWAHHPREIPRAIDPDLAFLFGLRFRAVAPAPLAWTSEPQEAGAYWHRPPGAPDHAYELIYVCIGTDRKALPAGEWFGPLPEPPPISEGGE